MILKLILTFIIGCLVGGMLGILVMALASAASFEDWERERLRCEDKREEDCIEQ